MTRLSLLKVFKMPQSKWNPDINWNDLSGQRLDYIVRSIYNATVERDYWYKVMSVDDVNPKQFVSQEFFDNDTLLGKNTLLELVVIYETFERWLRPYEKVKTDYPNGLDLYGLCFFPDDSVSNPDYTVGTGARNIFAFDRIYGLGNYDYSSGGSLSNLVGYDLSFLEDEYNYGELNGDHLRVFHDILNLNLKNRCFPCSWNQSSFSIPPSFISSIPVPSLFFSQLKKIKNEFILDDSYAQLVTDFNNAVYDEDPAYGLIQNFDRYSYATFPSESNTLRSEYSATYIDPTNFKGFNITDFNTDLVLTIQELRSVGNTVNFSYTTDAPISKRVTNNNTVINNVNGVYMLTEVDEIDVQSIGPVSSGQSVQGVVRQFYPQLFIDLNKEGFLSYYTEEAN